MNGIEFTSVQGTVISSVVPPLDSTLREVCERYFQSRPCSSNRASRLACRSITTIPPKSRRSHRQQRGRIREVRRPVHHRGLRNRDHLRRGLEEGRVPGRCDHAGIGISAEALFTRTARLPRVDVASPARAGHHTVNSVQSGLYYGYLGLIDGILERLIAELNDKVTVVATAVWPR